MKRRHVAVIAVALIVLAVGGSILRPLAALRPVA
jgi:hypothetical protein